MYPGTLENLLASWNVDRRIDRDCSPLIDRAMATYQAGVYESLANDGESAALVYKHHKRVSNGEPAVDYYIEIASEMRNGRLFIYPVTCECMSRSTFTGTELWTIGGVEREVCKHQCAVTCMLNDTQDYREAQGRLYAAAAKLDIAALSVPTDDDREWASTMTKFERNRKAKSRRQAA